MLIRKTIYVRSKILFQKTRVDKNNYFMLKQNKKLNFGSNGANGHQIGVPNSKICKNLQIWIYTPRALQCSTVSLQYATILLQYTIVSRSNIHREWDPRTGLRRSSSVGSGTFRLHFSL